MPRSVPSRLFFACVQFLCAAGLTFSLKAAPPEPYNKHCPVMTLESIDENLKLEYAGKTVYFCCNQCKKIWQRQANYIIKARGPEALPQFAGMEEELGLEAITLLPQRFCPVEKGALITPGCPSTDYKGAKVYFLNKDALEEWAKEPEKFAGAGVAAGILPQLQGKVAPAPVPTAEEEPKTKPDAVPVAAAAGNGEAAVLALFEKHCAECHGPQAKRKKKPDLHGAADLAKLLADDDIVVKGKPGESKLIGRVELPVDDEERMPMSSGAPGEATHRAPLTGEETALLRSWVEGALQKGGTPETAEAAEDAKTKPQEKSKPPAAARAVLPLERDVREVLADLEKQPAERRRFLRYLSLTNLHNTQDTKGNGCDRQVM